MLTDFGISIKKGSKLVTTVGNKLTFKYASIEQLDEKEAEPYFDVWSLGVITYQLMSGKFPYEAIHIRMITEIEKNQRPPLPDTYS